MDKYNHKQVEQKWREVWEKNNPTRAEDFSKKPKKFILAEFPYPSGEGLHIGHLMRYTMPDVYSRKLRMSGFNVMFPMGWDAFGLPAENYAVKTGVHPEITTKKAITTFKRQLQEMGFGFDWEREIATTDPKYYKWTQWIFLKLWEAGLAELKEEPVWWCEDLKTVLANEEVIKNEKGELISERGEKPVERRMLKQWVLKMPQYAEKLIEGLSTVDFPESIKHAQINWIGKSEGINISYEIKDTSEKITIFTTRPDTNFGATFIALAPEGGQLEKLLPLMPNKAKVEKYIKQATAKSELDRIASKEKTGEFTGLYAINNLNGREMPIYVSDFVIGTVGTGALVGVPGHDMRDFDFAKAMGIDILRVVVGSDGDTSEITEASQVQEEEGKMINSGFLDGMDIHDATQKIMDHIVEKGWGEKVVNYKLRDWLFSRQRYWGEPIPLIHKENGEVEAVCDVNDPQSVKEDLPLLLPQVPDYTPSSDAASPLAKNEDWVNTVDSEGKPAKRETNTMPNWAGSCWYYLRYIDPNNDQAFADKDKLKYWLPVDKYFGGSEHTTLHLLYSRFWHKFLFDQGEVPTSEPYAWRMNGGLLMGTDGSKMSKSKGNVLNPDEKVSAYGADAVRLYINFMSPYDQNAIWQEGGLKACRRLIEDVWNLQSKVSDSFADRAVEVAYHKMVKNVGTMVDELKTNTAVSEFMMFANKVKEVGGLSLTQWEGFLKVLAPFAPFITEELWAALGHNGSIHLESWPEYDESKLQEDNITIAVQVNGKVRDTISIPVDADEAAALGLAHASEKVAKFLEGKQVVKEIYVKGKIVNIVVKG
ncbi:MAG: leucine--tRNA ligase [Candidatus Doudnabacteria bacterium]|nr:leucine--tRNA ligase [Candidatus Doudnabacteria bacterium]